MRRQFRYLFLLLCGNCNDIAAQDTAPPLSLRLRPELVRAANMVWGLSSPIPLFAGQIQQESGWQPNAVSKAGARGLTQFMPETEKWLAERYNTELGDGHALDPRWAIRAQVRYMRYLFETLGGETECDALRFALSGYNGGMTWVVRDRLLAAGKEMNPNRYDEVAPFNSGRSLTNFAENREYPRKIVQVHQEMYKSWGRLICTPTLRIDH
jgi:hypothetical protein